MEELLAQLRKQILTIHGQSAAFGMVEAKGDLAEAQAAKETGLQIHQESSKALLTLNLLQRKMR